MDIDYTFYTAEQTKYAIRLLQSPPDYSAVNIHSRNRARKYLSSLNKQLHRFEQKKQDSNVAVIIRRKIADYQFVIDWSLDQES